MSHAVEILERRALLSAGSVVFDAMQSYPAPNGVAALTVADVNRDGHPDIIAPAGSAGSGTIFFGNGDGTFHAGSTFTNPQCFNVVAADLNGDGRVDLVMDGGSTSDAFFVAIGNGDGTFQPTHTVGVLPLEDSLVVADINGDGCLDLVGGSGRNAGLQILLGNGDGTFKPQYSLVVGTAPYGLVVADLNGDGKTDIAAGDSFAPVSILLGNGDGTFAPRTTAANSMLQTAMAAGDINGDGRIDLVASVNPGLEVYLGNGDGSFGAPKTFAGSGGTTFSITLADANNDGKLDVIQSNGNSGGVCVCLGNGDGTFGPKQVSATGKTVGSTVAADLNNDGRLDAVSIGASEVDVALGNVPPSVVSIVPTVNGTTPNYTADSSLNYVVTFSEPVTGVDPTDFQVVTTGSATANPVVAVSGGSTVYTVTVSGIGGGQSLANPSDAVTLGLNVVNDGSIVDASGQNLQSRSFVLLGAAKTFSASNGTWQVAAADINGDGKTDIALANYVASTVSVALGNGDGTFGLVRTFAVGTHPYSVAAIDVNRDGRADLVVSNQGANNIGVLLGNGDGTFAPQVTFATGSSPWTVSSADVNRDGNPDLLVANKNSNSLSVLLGNGNGTFKPQLTFATGTSPRQIALADFDGDGRIDVAAPNRTAKTVTVLLGNGDGTFHAGAALNLGASADAVFAADLNGDGKADLVASGEVLLGNGDGTFGPPSAAGIDPFVVADMNIDGKLDLLGFGGGTSEVQLGNGDGTFAPPQPFAAPSATTWTVADVDQNGYPDVLTGSTYSSTVGSMLAKGDGSFVGKTVYVVPYLNVATYPVPYTSITLMRNLDGLHIDAFSPRGFAIGQVLITDPLGMTIDGNGQTDEIHLGYTNGNPFPNTLHLSGKFTVTGLQGTNPLANTGIDIGQSTVYFAYTPGSSPLAAVQQALEAGYNGGAWNGGASGSGGAITSTSAAANPARYSIGYADSADGSGANTTPNSIEIKYTLNGDANLNGAVDIFDLNALLSRYNSTGVWTGGDFTYNGAVDVFDLNAMLPNYNRTIPAVSSDAAPPADANTLSAAAVNGPSAAPASSLATWDHPVHKRHAKRPQRPQI